MIVRKSAAEIERMEKAGSVVARTLELLGEHICPGVTTAELDEIADEFIRSHGGVPTFKGYRGYPASICASPNAMIVQGIPGPYELRDGDILSVDVGVTLGGFVADSAYTFPVGDVEDDTPETIARRLEVYHRETAPLTDYYRADGNLVGIHADRSIDEVFAEIQDTLERLRTDP